MFTLKQFSNGSRFTATAILQSEFTPENKQAIAEDIKRQVEAQGGEVIITDSKVEVKGGTQFWLLPKLPKERKGYIEFRSKDYIFYYDGKQSFGNKPKASDITPTGFTLTMY